MPDGGRRGYRRMYWLTGQPRWARYRFPYLGYGYQPGAVIPSFYRCQRFPWLPRWWWAGIDPGFQAPFQSPAFSKEEELSVLREEATALEEELKVIRKRIEEFGE